MDMKDCPAYIREYIFYLRVIKNRSEKTISSYYIDLRLFLRYIKENIMNAKGDDIDVIADVPFSVISGITLADVYEYLNYSAEERGNNDKTRARKISAIKGFYKAVCNNKLTSFHLEVNPVEQLDVQTVMFQNIRLQRQKRLIGLLLNEEPCSLGVFHLHQLHRIRKPLRNLMIAVDQDQIIGLLFLNIVHIDSSAL